MNEASNTTTIAMPLAQNLRYPRNHWYVAAGRPEVTRTPLGRRLLGKCVVLYRTEAGAPVAMDDWCPHRGFRLSDSKLVGDAIQCGYHGIRFNTSGACVHIPSQDMIPSKMAVTTYPVIERLDFIWIWMGDPSKANAALLPDVLEFDDPSYYSGFSGSLTANCSAAVALENAIDITHASLIHPGVLDSTDNWELMTAEDEVELVQPSVVQTTKKFGKMKVSGLLAERNGLPQNTEVNRIRVARQYLPGLHTSCETYFDAHKPSDILARRIRYVGFTPQTDRSCFIFSAYSGTTYRDAKTLTQAMAILKQDVAAIEATQAYFEQGGESFKEVSVRADRAAIMARRIISNLAAHENTCK